MFRLALAVAVLSVMSVPALAHPGEAQHGASLVAGLSHPFLGLDHVLAMLAVGAWAALQGGRARWAVPGAFVLSMLGGFALAVSGTGLPLVEPGIAASVLVFGLLLATAVRVPTASAIVLVALFAAFHGYAHGNEVTGSTVGFGVGFAAATITLHAIGIGLTLALAGSRSLLARAFGWITAGVGLALLGSLA